MADDAKTRAARQDFAAEKERMVHGPRRDALRTDSVLGGRLVVDASSNEPARRFGLESANVKFAADYEGLRRIAAQSPTYRNAARALRLKQVKIEEAVEELSRETGGGTTQGAPGPRPKIIIWPPVIPTGFHVIDVYVHEFGHVVDAHGGQNYHVFLNAVQKDLGLRLTPDPHAIPPQAERPTTPGPPAPGGRPRPRVQP